MFETKLIRFLFFPGSQTFEKEISKNISLDELKNILLRQYGDFNVSIRLIFSGRELRKDTDLEILFDKPNQVTVHVVISTSGQLSSSWEHFHGCFYEEEESKEMSNIFKSFTSDNYKYAIAYFLRTYWRWMKKTENFPEEKLNRIFNKILGQSENVTCLQFKQIFFLFDNNTVDTICPHGHKERIEASVRELHKVFSEEEFNVELFENIFSEIDRDRDDTLTCLEIELLYFTYCNTVC